MAGRIFIDTAGFFSLLVRSDSAHGQAVKILKVLVQSKQDLVTTDYILDETVTLLKVRGLNHVAPQLFDRVLTSQFCRICWMDQEWFIKTKGFFLKHKDHAWSFTDCFSFLVMNSLRVSEALTTDRHFREAGFLPLLA